MSGIVIHILIQGTIFGTVIGVPFVYVFRTGRFARGVFLTWGLMILTYFIFSVVLGLLLHSILDSDFIVKFLPEAIYVTASSFMGWVGGLQISALAYLTRWEIKKQLENKHVSSNTQKIH